MSHARVSLEPERSDRVRLPPTVSTDNSTECRLAGVGATDNRSSAAVGLIVLA